MTSNPRNWAKSMVRLGGGHGFRIRSRVPLPSLLSFGATVLLATCVMTAIIATRPAQAASVCVSPPSGMVSWWAGDGNATDIVGVNSGTLKGGASFGAGKVGQAFSLNGVDAWVQIPHNPNLNPSGPFSVDVWIKASPHQTDDRSLIVDKSHGFVDDTGWVLQSAPGGRMQFSICKGGGTGSGANCVVVTTSTSVLDDQWHFLAGVFTGSHLEVYLDGILQETRVTSGPVGANARDASIGRSWGGGRPQRYFHGLVDEVEFFDRALSNSEIQAIYAAGSEGKCKSCEGVLPKVSAVISAKSGT